MHNWSSIVYTLWYCHNHCFTLKEDSLVIEKATLIIQYLISKDNDLDFTKDINDMIKELLINKAGMQYFIIKENDIKIDSKFIDDKKLESCLSDIMNSIKNDN